MPKASQIVATHDTVKTVELTDANGVVFHLTYAADRMTVEILHEFRAIEQGRVPEDEGLDSIAKMLKHVLISWDLERDEDDELLPITLENLYKLGIGMLYFLFYGVMADSQPGELKSKPSVSPLPLRANSGKRRTGSTMSRRPKN